MNPFQQVLWLHLSPKERWKASPYPSNTKRCPIDGIDSPCFIISGLIMAPEATKMTFL